MTRRAVNGRDAARTYRRASLPATATALLALASFAGSCTPLPSDDDDRVKKGTEAPKGGRRPDGGETGRVIVDPCKDPSSASSSTRNKQASQSQVLFQSDFETPNIPLVANCGKWLHQTEINDLFGTDTFQFAQAQTVEGVVLQDDDGVYTDPTGQGGRYAIGMLSDVQDDMLAMTFTNALPYVNVRLDLSAIAIAGCGVPVEISTPRLKIDIYDTSSGKLNLMNITQEPLDSKIVTGSAGDDPWEFNWRTAVASLDASGATDGNVTVVFDLLEGGYAAIDNLSVVASTQKGVADADNNGVADDTQCAGESDATDEADASVRARDAGARDAGTSTRTATDAGAPPAAPPAAQPTPPAAQPTPAPATPPVAATPPAPTSSRDTDADDEEDTPPASQRDAGSRSSGRDSGGSLLDRLRDGGLFGN
ncbi:MAG: hypothetical protein ABW252_14895 [Polyangiales bacterium]